MGVNAANENDFWYKATILYTPYGQTLRDVLGLLYSLHVHKKSKFLIVAFINIYEHNLFEKGNWLEKKI